MIETETITFDEFRAWLTGLIVGKRGALPDLDDWKMIKEMLDKVVPDKEKEIIRIPAPFPDPKKTEPYDKQWPTIPRPTPWQPSPPGPFPKPRWVSPNTGDPIPNPNHIIWCSESSTAEIPGGGDGGTSSHGAEGLNEAVGEAVSNSKKEESFGIDKEESLQFDSSVNAFTGGCGNVVMTQEALETAFNIMFSAQEEKCQTQEENPRP